MADAVVSGTPARVSAPLKPAYIVAALAIVTVLTVQGLGYLLPMNLKLYFEIQKPAPDHDKLGRWMRTYVRVVAVQGTMQVAIIVVMARFATGF